MNKNTPQTINETMDTFKIERTQTAMGTRMTRGDYNEYRGWTLPDGENGDDKGVMLVNGDHVSWIPKPVFEKECLLIEDRLNGKELDPETSIPKKTLGNTCSNRTIENVSDVTFWGNRDTFKLISKASSEKEGWMKSTKAMQCGNSVVVQVTTQQRNPDGSYAVAEAVTTVPNAVISKHKEDGKVIFRTIA